MSDNAEYKKAFALFDKKGVGAVPRERLGALLRALGQGPTQAEMAEIVASAPREVDYKTFLAILNRPDGFKPAGTAEVLDKESNRFIGAGELRYVPTQLGEKMSDDEVGELPKVVHVSTDGNANYNFDFLDSKRNLVVRLPDEILSAIFLAVPRAVGHAFALADTCKWWRAVALHSRRLWARVICVLQDTDDVAAEGRWAGYLRTHLARAGPFLLDARLEYSCNAYLKPNSPLRAAILAVWQHSAMFELVTVLEFDRKDNPFDFIREPAPHLIDLHVEQSMQCYSGGALNTVKLALSAPKLAKFTFTGAKLDFARGSGSPCPGVAEADVTVNYLGGHALPALFACFPNLEKLDLCLSCDLDAFSESPVIGNHLRTLRLRLPSGTIDLTSADVLRFPSLRAAFVHIKEIDTHEPDAIMSFMRNALGNVEELHLQFDLVPGLAEGIAACTRLKHLVLQSVIAPIFDADGPVAIVEALGLADRHGVSWPCPQLETITILGEMAEGGLAQKLLVLAEARRALAVPISRIDVQGFDALQNRLNETLGSSAV